MKSWQLSDIIDKQKELPKFEKKRQDLVHNARSF